MWGLKLIMLSGAAFSPVLKNRRPHIITVNLHIPQADELYQRFRPYPQAYKPPLIPQLDSGQQVHS